MTTEHNSSIQSLRIRHVVVFRSFLVASVKNYLFRSFVQARTSTVSSGDMEVKFKYSSRHSESRLFHDRMFRGGYGDAEPLERVFSKMPHKC